MPCLLKVLKLQGEPQTRQDGRENHDIVVALRVFSCANSIIRFTSLIRLSELFEQVQKGAGC